MLAVRAAPGNTPEPEESCRRADSTIRVGRITAGIKLRGPERSEGLVSFNVLVGQQVP